MNKDCIIIGNASNILEQNLGEKIDKFENVIRFNRFRIEHTQVGGNQQDFKHDLGTKCTHWVCGWQLVVGRMPVNPKYFVQNFEQIKKTHPELKEVLVLSSTATKKHLSEFEKVKEFIKKHDISKDMNNNITEHPVKLIYQEYEKFFHHKPTTGFMAINYFLDIFPSITVAGFDFGQSVHYWGKENFVDKPAPETKHPWTKEREFVEEQVKLNKIELL